jgi:peroxiredoxin Q/BCP
MLRQAVPLAIPFALAFAAPRIAAQQPTTPDLAVGAVAPDFTLPGATRYGVLKAPIHLSDFKGKTVVLAFFYKARTKG